jgi:hypothetical protein
LGKLTRVSFSCPYADFLREIQIAALAHGDRMLAGEQQQFFRSLQFAEVAHILIIYPNTRCILDLRRAHQIDFTQHFVIGVGARHGGREKA